jgi:hypothetical protein
MGDLAWGKIKLLEEGKRNMQSSSKNTKASPGGSKVA